MSVWIFLLVKIKCQRVCPFGIFNIHSFVDCRLRHLLLLLSASVVRLSFRLTLLLLWFLLVILAFLLIHIVYYSAHNRFVHHWDGLLQSCFHRILFFLRRLRFLMLLLRLVFLFLLLCLTRCVRIFLGYFLRRILR